MKNTQASWNAPIVVPETDPVMVGLVRRAEVFLQELLDESAGALPLSKLKDLERYLRSLPNQGAYFAEAIRDMVDAPSFMPSVQVSVVGRRMSVDDIDTDTDTSAQESEDLREWREEWREKVKPSIGPYWDLVLEAIRANQKA